MTTKQQQNALASKYVKLFTAKYGHKPTNFNRYRDQWGFSDMVTDLGYERAGEVLSYYMTTSRPGNPVQYLFYNYEKYDNLMRELAEDEANRTQLREQTRRRVEEMESRGNE